MRQAAHGLAVGDGIETRRHHTEAATYVTPAISPARARASTRSFAACQTSCTASRSGSEKRARRVELPDQSTSWRSAGPDESPLRLDLIQEREIVVRDSLMFLARNSRRHCGS